MSRINVKNRCPFIIGESNTKVGSQEITGVTGKFELGVQKEAGQRLAEFCPENMMLIEDILFHQPKRHLYTWTLKNGRE